MKKSVIFAFLALILLFSAGCSCGNEKIGREKAAPTPEPTPEIVLTTPEPTPLPTPVPAPEPIITYSEWSSWTEKPSESSETREVETREIKGYDLVLYVTQDRDPPHSRLFRDKSIGNMYGTYAARLEYGEKVYTRFATEDEIRSAATYEFGDFVKGDFAGLVRGDGEGYLIPGDSKLWYIQSPATKTEYRYRDISISYGG